MKIKTFKTDHQRARLGRHEWQVTKLFELSRNLPVMEIPLDHLNLSDSYGTLRLREMVMHMKAVNDANLSFPIILDEDGEIMDGRHRVMKAILNGEKSIKAVRFDENPEPCYIVDDK